MCTSTVALRAVAAQPVRGPLAERIGTVGCLARELLDGLPLALDESRNSR